MRIEDILNQQVVLTFDSKDSDSEEFADEIGEKYEFVKITPTGVKDQPQLAIGRGVYLRGRKDIQEFLSLYEACKKPKARPKTKILLEAFLSQH